MHRNNLDLHIWTVGLRTSTIVGVENGVVAAAEGHVTAVVIAVDEIGSAAGVGIAVAVGTAAGAETAAGTAAGTVAGEEIEERIAVEETTARTTGDQERVRGKIGVEMIRGKRTDGGEGTTHLMIANRVPAIPTQKVHHLPTAIRYVGCSDFSIRSIY